MQKRFSLKAAAHAAVHVSLATGIAAQAADVSVSAPTGSGFSVSTPALPDPALRVDEGGLVIRGTHGQGSTPASGPGTRMMFDANTGAFRSGQITGTEWDAADLGEYSFAGGYQVKASSTAGVAFGTNVTTSGTAGFAAGSSNTCSGFACMAVGYTNTASGQGAVALGYRTTANADYSVALGNRVSSGGHKGSFAFGDASVNGVTPSLNTADNEFMARATGGFRLRTSADLSTGCDLPAGSGVFSCTSDRNQKEDFQVPDAQEVLAKIVSLPITQWRYIAEPGNVRHMGPMAQDFHAAFGLGPDDVTIGVNDLASVGLVAIQALAARTEQLQARSQEVETLRAEVAALRQALVSIEQRLSPR